MFFFLLAFGPFYPSHKHGLMDSSSDQSRGSTPHMIKSACSTAGACDFGSKFQRDQHLSDRRNNVDPFYVTTAASSYNCCCVCADCVFRGLTRNFMWCCPALNCCHIVYFQLILYVSCCLENRLIFFVLSPNFHIIAMLHGNFLLVQNSSVTDTKFTRLSSYFW